MGRGDRDHRADQVGVHHRGIEGQHAAVTLADQGGIALAECSDHARHIGRQGEGVVAARWLVRLAGTAQVGRDHMESGLCQAGQLVAPVRPEAAEPVQ